MSFMPSLRGPSDKQVCHPRPPKLWVGNHAPLCKSILKPWAPYYLTRACGSHPFIKKWIVYLSSPFATVLVSFAEWIKIAKRLTHNCLNIYYVTKTLPGLALLLIERVYFLAWDTSMFGRFYRQTKYSLSIWPGVRTFKDWLAQRNIVFYE